MNVSWIEISFLSLTSKMTQVTDKPLIIAHRGESHDAPENTMAAINLTWERDALVVEIDVQLSKDKKLVVIYDLNTKRFAGLYKNVKDQTLKELRKLDVGS